MKHPLADPNCPICKGFGQVRVPMKGKPPKSRLCECTYIGQMNSKLEKKFKLISLKFKNQIVGS